MKRSLIKVIAYSYLLISSNLVAGDYSLLKTQCDQILKRCANHPDLGQTTKKLLDKISEMHGQVPTRDNVKGINREADQVCFKAMSLIIDKPTNILLWEISEIAHEICNAVFCFRLEGDFNEPRMNAVIDNIVGSLPDATLAALGEEGKEKLRHGLLILRNHVNDTTVTLKHMHFMSTITRIFAQRKVHQMMKSGRQLPNRIFALKELHENINQVMIGSQGVIREYYLKYVKPFVSDEAKAKLDALFGKMREDNWSAQSIAAAAELITPLKDEAALYAHNIAVNSISGLRKELTQEGQQRAIDDALAANKFCSVVFNLLNNKKIDFIPTTHRTYVVMRELDRIDKQKKRTLEQIISDLLPRFTKEDCDNHDKFHMIASIVSSIMEHNPHADFSKEFLVPTISAVGESCFGDIFRDFFILDRNIYITDEILKNIGPSQFSDALKILEKTGLEKDNLKLYECLIEFVRMAHVTEPYRCGLLKQKIDEVIDFGENYVHEYGSIRQLAGAVEPFIFDMEGIKQVFNSLPRITTLSTMQSNTELSRDATFIILMMMIKALVFANDPGNGCQGRYVLCMPKELIIASLTEEKPEFEEYFPRSTSSSSSTPHKPNVEPDDCATDDVDIQVLVNPLECHLNMLQVLAGEQKNLKQLLSMVQYLGVQLCCLQEDYSAHIQEYGYCSNKDYLAQIIQGHYHHILVSPIWYDRTEACDLIASAQLSKNVGAEKFTSIIETFILPEFDPIDLTKDQARLIVKQNVFRVRPPILDSDHIIIVTDVLLEQISTRTPASDTIQLITDLLEWIPTMNNPEATTKLDKAKYLLQIAAAIYEIEQRSAMTNDLYNKTKILEGLLELQKMIKQAKISLAKVKNEKVNPSVLKEENITRRWDKSRNLRN